MKPLLAFDDAGATDDHPAKGVTVGNIRAWFDALENLRHAALILLDECGPTETPSLGAVASLKAAAEAAKPK